MIYNEYDRTNDYTAYPGIQAPSPDCPGEGDVPGFKSIPGIGMAAAYPGHFRPVPASPTGVFLGGISSPGDQPGSCST